ncbi:hypothetical protein TRFO_13012 [Tritrichomonas foetus]|uniref:Sel1 repeat family protein n=1 Tax=Tritrichomonas foetus TaxID=1144522 RepID=A0A1J4L437_9EUKA|nr:hypothetical protein TRFO_13012 [Tritrichomonas foetus]|eukprot:OHT16740.1 hypothetical protein TRFO_13012 [Tritrichomonas foetus]
MFLFTFLSINTVWQSIAPWKYGLTMDDPDYLPVPPIFTLIKPNKWNSHIIGDLLSIRTVPEFDPVAIIHGLNKDRNPGLILDRLQHNCTVDHISQACLILGRIYEFGAYNQTENLSLSYELYQKVVEFGDSSANSMLSFFHRHYDYNFPASIVEADSSNTIESILSKALQYDRGFLRPLSCPTSASLLLPIAEAVSQLYIFPPPKPLDKSEIERLNNSTDMVDLYNSAMHQISVPYPSKKEIHQAKEKLEQSLNKGYVKASAPLAQLNIELSTHRDSNEISKKLVQSALKIKDPAASFVAFQIKLHENDIASLEQARRFLIFAAENNYVPAIHELAVHTYFGFLGLGRNDKKAYQMFKMAAAKGYLPSMFRAAKQLLGGDGTIEDCNEASKMLRRVLDLGPWSKFYDKYVEKGSKHALRLMLDMSLTPAKIFPINDTESSFIHTNTQSSSTIASHAKAYESKIANNLQEQEYVQKMRKAREGDPSAILWLSIKSPLLDSSMWIERLKEHSPRTRMLVPPVKLFITLRTIFLYFKGELNEKEIEYTHAIFSYFKPQLKILSITFSLVLLVVARVKLTIIDRNNID